MIRVTIYTTAPEHHGVSWPAFPKTYEFPSDGGEVKDGNKTIQVEVMPTEEK